MHDKVREVVGLYRIEKIVCLLCGGRKRWSVIWEAGRVAQLLALLVELLVVVLVADPKHRHFADFSLSTPFLNPLLDDHFQTLLPDLLSALLPSKTAAGLF